MNSNTTTQGAAGASAGAALAVSTLIIWVLSLRGLAVPADVATALVTLLTVGTHAMVTYMTPKNAAVNVPVEAANQSVEVPTQTVPGNPMVIPSKPV